MEFQLPAFCIEWQVTLPGTTQVLGISNGFYSIPAGRRTGCGKLWVGNFEKCAYIGMRLNYDIWSH